MTVSPKIIKIFLASSDELAEERVRFGDFIRQLDDMYEIRGYRIKLYKWEDLPSGDDGRPKQDEYNDKVRECDMFVGLFHTKAGKFTLEEYDTAKNTQKASGKPTLYVFCREVKDGEQEEQSLKEFKAKLLQDIRHYWNKYSSSDSLQLQFVLQLLKVENSHWGDLKIENGQVRFGEMEIAQMGNLPFAAANKDYQRMSQRMQEIPTLVEKARLRVEKYPDDDDLRDDLQRLIEERNQLQEEFDQHQKYLLDTAIRIVQLQGEQISENRKRAQEAFEQGDVQKANIILDEAERNGDSLFDEYERNESLQAQRREIIHQTIDDLIFQISTVMADIGRPINERVEKVNALYNKADRRASATGYSTEKYSMLLFDYAGFLSDYGYYHEAEKVYLRQITYFEELLGKTHINTAISYNNVGNLYYRQRNYPNAIEFYEKSMAIKRDYYGEESFECASSYNNLGESYSFLGNYSKAEEFLTKAAAIYMKSFGETNEYVAISLTNLGSLYLCLKDYQRALEYSVKAIRIYEDLSLENPAVAASYNNVGVIYCRLGNYSEALNYHRRAVTIRVQYLGINHPETAVSYDNIGEVYKKQGNHLLSLSFYGKALSIRIESYGPEHHISAQTYRDIGDVYDDMGEYSRAIEYYMKALKIDENLPDTKPIDLADSIHLIGLLYYQIDEYEKSLMFLNRAADIYEKQLGEEDNETQSIKALISDISDAIGSKTN